MNPELSSFAARLCDCIAAGFQNQDFDAWAVELFYLQFYANPAYQDACRRRRVDPATVSASRETAPTMARWKRIPFVPTAVFKTLEFFSAVSAGEHAAVFSCISAAERTAAFHSSGTTGKATGRHFHNAESLAVYETSLWHWFQSRFGETGDLLSLTPGPSAAPHSSLVHMFETVRRKLAQPESVFAGAMDAENSWTVDFFAAIQRLQSAVDQARPLTILGTAFSFVHLLDHLAEYNLRFELPPGSRVMETGGYKNRSRILPKAELHKLIRDRLGVPLQNIVCEYGMSELSSQAYDGEALGAGSGVWDDNTSRFAPDAPRRFHFPPWARVQIISPETGREVAGGETGLIRVFDLANVFSVAAIQTEDLGVHRGGGFELVGRAPSAEPRGCSLNHPEFKN